MKQKFVLVFIIFIAFGCKKKEAEPIDQTLQRPYTGAVTAIKNGKPWAASVFSMHQPAGTSPLTDRFVISFYMYAKMGEDSVVRDVLYLTNLQHKVYNADLVNYVSDSTRKFKSANETENAHYSEFYEDGDVVSLPRTILESAPHWIEITSYDLTNREVTGKFAVTFLSYSKNDTFRFEEGVFKTKIYP